MIVLTVKKFQPDSARVTVTVTEMFVCSNNNGVAFLYQQIVPVSQQYLTSVSFTQYLAKWFVEIYPITPECAFLNIS